MKRCKWCNGMGRKITNIPGFSGGFGVPSIPAIVFKSVCEKCHGKGAK